MHEAYLRTTLRAYPLINDHIQAITEELMGVLPAMICEAMNAARLHADDDITESSLEIRHEPPSLASSKGAHPISLYLHLCDNADEWSQWTRGMVRTQLYSRVNGWFGKRPMSDELRGDLCGGIKVVVKLESSSGAAPSPVTGVPPYSWD